MKITTIIFRDRPFRYTVLWTLIQQGMVATGTFLLGKLAMQASAGSIDPSLAIGFFVAVALPGTGVHFAISSLLVRSKNSVMKTFYDRHQSAYLGRVDLWRDSTAKSQCHDPMLRTGPDAIHTTLHFAVDAIATTCNVVFNTVAVGLSTDLRLSGSIAVASLIGILLVKAQDRSITTTARNEIEATNRLTGHLTRSWDNTLLGYPPAFNRWKTEFESQFKAFADASFRGVVLREGIIASSGVITNLIVVGSTLLICFYPSQMNPGNLVALIAMLPRSLQIVMHAQVIQR
ncbi:MAG: hypothetical protein AAB425_08195, partial [Bdellovibrionota bacterium]